MQMEKEKLEEFNIDNSILEELKTFSFYTSISEVRKISYLESIFKELDKNWDVIYFKIYNFLKLLMEIN